MCMCVFFVFLFHLEMERKWKEWMAEGGGGGWKGGWKMDWKEEKMDVERRKGSVTF